MAVPFHRFDQDRHQRPKPLVIGQQWLNGERIDAKSTTLSHYHFSNRALPACSCFGPA